MLVLESIHCLYTCMQLMILYYFLQLQLLMMRASLPVCVCACVHVHTISMYESIYLLCAGTIAWITFGVGGGVIVAVALVLLLLLILAVRFIIHQKQRIHAHKLQWSDVTEEVNFIVQVRPDCIHKVGFDCRLRSVSMCLYR